MRNLPSRATRSPPDHHQAIVAAPGELAQLARLPWGRENGALDVVQAANQSGRETRVRYCCSLARALIRSGYVNHTWTAHDWPACSRELSGLSLSKSRSFIFIGLAGIWRLGQG